jgi:hypothetical protein
LIAKDLAVTDHLWKGPVGRSDERMGIFVQSDDIGWGERPLKSRLSIWARYG